MANTAKQLGQALVSTSGNTVYTVATGAMTIVKSFDIANSVTNLVRVRVHLVASGGSASTSNAIMYDFPLVGNGIFGWEGEQVLSEGGSIRVAGNVVGGVITVSGVEIT